MANRLDVNSPGLRRQLIMTLIQNTPAAYAVLGRDYRIIFLNDFFMRARKMEGPVPVGEKCYATINNGVPCPQCAVHKAIENGRPARMLRKDVLPDGTVTYTDDFAVPIRKDPQTNDFDCILQVMVSRTNEMLLWERNNRLFLDIVYSLIRQLERRSPHTCAHSRNVAAIVTKLTRYLGMGSQAVFHSALGGLLHDLGMFFVPREILEKRMVLSSEEYSTVKEHPVYTGRFLAGLTSFGTLRDIAVSHHERWDGGGYPNGVGGEDIPLEARVAAVADAYDAMTSDRPHRRALSHAEAMAEINRQAGSQFDPRIAGKFIQMVEDGGLDRDTLVALPDKYAVPAPEFTLYEHHGGGWGPSGDGRAEADCLKDAMASDAFLESVFNNTPALYAIVDEGFNILFASDSLAAVAGKSPEEMLSCKCFDIIGNGIGLQCQRRDGDNARCIVAKAFATGERQQTPAEADASGQKLYFDSFAVPLLLDGADGGKIKCCMKIAFDRTRENTARHALEGDLRQLIDKMRALAQGLVLDAAAGARETTREAGSFSEYLDGLKADLSSAAPSAESRG